MAVGRELLAAAEAAEASLRYTVKIYVKCMSISVVPSLSFFLSLSLSLPLSLFLSLYTNVFTRTHANVEHVTPSLFSLHVSFWMPFFHAEPT